jgi:hypothetical protein
MRLAYVKSVNSNMMTGEGGGSENEDNSSEPKMALDIVVLITCILGHDMTNRLLMITAVTLLVALLLYVDTAFVDASKDI